MRQQPRRRREVYRDTLQLSACFAFFDSEHAPPQPDRDPPTAACCSVPARASPPFAELASAQASYSEYLSVGKFKIQMSFRRLPKIRLERWTKLPLNSTRQIVHMACRFRRLDGPLKRDRLCSRGRLAVLQSCWMYSSYRRRRSCVHVRSHSAWCYCCSVQSLTGKDSKGHKKNEFYV